MATGVFEAREDDGYYYYFANNSGEIQQSQIGFTMRENGIIQKTESCTLMELKQLVVKILFHV